MKDLSEIWRQTNWFAIQTKTYKEGLAATSVAALDIEVFLPHAKQRQPVGGILRWVTKPLFAGYIFACFTPVEMIEAVRCARGVLRVVGSSRVPIPVDAGVIAELREHSCPEDGLIRLETKGFLPGASLMVEEGPFQGFFGKVEGECDDGRRVAILLDALHHARLLIDKGSVAATTSA